MTAQPPPGNQAQPRAHPPAGLAALLRHRPFRRQFTARAVSLTGTALAPVATAFGVLKATGSPAVLGLVLASYSLPMLLLMVVGGVWADRLPQHRVMMAADTVRFGTQTSFGLILIAHHAPLGVMMALQATSGVAAAFAQPATLGLTTATAPEGAFQQASALLAVTNNVTGVIGPALGGVLTETVGAGWALVVDGLSYLGSALLLSGLDVGASRRPATGFLAEVRQGWAQVRNRSWLWSSIGFFALFNLVYAVFTVLGPVQLHGRRDGALLWGVVMVAVNIGSLCGNALALRTTPRYLLRWPRLLQLAAIPLIIALAVGGSPVLLAGGAFLMGLAMSFPDALWFTALQQEIPAEAISRVSSFDLLGSTALRPVGYSVAGLLVASPTRSLLVTAAVFAAAILATFAAPGTRHLTRAS